MSQDQKQSKENKKKLLDKPIPPSPPDKTKQSNKTNSENKNRQHMPPNETNSTSIKQTIIDTLTNKNKQEKDQKIKSFKDYPIRDLVKHSEDFGKYLKRGGLDTNQIRKFLDAIIRIKVKKALAKEDKSKAETTKEEETKAQEIIFQKIESDIVLLKPKLAYAAARNSKAEKAARDLNEVMSETIDRVHSLEDFERLVQFIESIIAYHKSAK